MNRISRLVGFLLFAGFIGLGMTPAPAQIKVTGDRKVVATQETPVVIRERPVFQRRRPWRERNPFYVARPVYPPAPPGARAKITFEPFTSKYYPTINSYYPRVNPQPTVPIR